MDRNKVVKLKQINYRLQSACGLCAHGNFDGQVWGTCNKHSYKHAKHTGDERQLSIHFSGVCPDFQQSESIASSIAHFASFLGASHKMTREQAERLSETLKQHQGNDEFRLALIEKACGGFSGEKQATWREKGICEFWPDCSCRNECAR